MDIITEIKMLKTDDDLNAYYLSEEKELIKQHFSRIEEINEKIRMSRSSSIEMSSPPTLALMVTGKKFY